MDYDDWSKKMDIALETGREDQRLIFEDVRRRGDSIECTLVVDSKGFMARRRFLFSQLSETISQLEQMYSELKGKIRLQEPYWDSLIELECDNRGHIKITGQLVEHSDVSQCLEFGFVTDQTCLEPLIRSLKKIPT